jgi:hyaluronoglucosaminidase
METFSKVSDGLEGRLDFYAQEGMTHYFYCPSDDRYCNRWGWKFLYNDSDRHAVRGYKALCHEKGLEFVWTLDPGERFRWDKDDYKFLLDKLIMMYYNGIRSFAVSFTDNPGDYVALRDSLMKDFVATRHENVDLYMLDCMPVVRYPATGKGAVESMMKGYHFDETFVADAKSGNCVVCNLSSSDEFSKLALYSVADFARNPVEYSAEESMAKAVESLQGGIKEAFMTFLRHTREVEESKDVTVFDLNGWSKEKSLALRQEFERIEAVPHQIRSNASAEIVSALEPWLVEFGRLGTRGMKVLDCMRYYKTGDLGMFWQTYLSTVMSEDEIVSYKSYPVGRNKLHPFCVEALEAMKEGFASMLTGKTKLHNLASTLYAANAALDSDFATCLSSEGHVEFAIPAEANTCHLLTGCLPAGKRVIFRQLRTDGSLVAEFVVKSPYTTFDIKEGAVKVDILGDVDVYENIFVYL